MKKLIGFIVILIALLAFVLNGPLIRDTTFKWVDKNQDSPSAPSVLMRSAIWCDWTGSDAQALEMYRAVWERYPEAEAFCAQALYETAYYHSQTTARRNANPYLMRIIDEYPAQTKWQGKAKELWDEVNHVL